METTDVYSEAGVSNQGLRSLLRTPDRRAWPVAGLALAVIAVALALPKDLNLTIALLGVFAVGIPALWLLWREPAVMVGLLLFLNAGFIPASLLDVRLGFGGLDMIDLGLLALIVVLGLRQALQRRLSIPWWSVSGPLLLFVALAFLSAMYALLLRQVAPNYTFSELRPIIYYLAFFAAAWSIRERRQVVIVLASMFLIANLVAAVIILQQFSGLDHPLIESVMTGGGRTWLLWSVPGISSGFGSVRVVPAGHVLMYSTCLVAFCCMLYRKLRTAWRLFCAAEFIFLNVGLLLTYTRAQWISEAVAVILVMTVLLILSRHHIIPLLLMGVLALVLALSVLGLSPASPNSNVSELTTSNPILARLSTIFTPDETLDTGSLQWRVFENEEAVQSISASPITGVGLGNEYRGATLLRQRETVGNLRFARFIHSAYFYIAVKMGLPALVVFAWLCLAFLISGWRIYQRLPEGYGKPVALAMLASFVGLLLWSNTQPNFILVEGTLFVGIMMGMLAALEHIHQVKEARANVGVSLEPAL
jgi:O-antigen ligase